MDRRDAGRPVARAPQSRPEQDQAPDGQDLPPGAIWDLLPPAFGGAELPPANTPGLPPIQPSTWGHPPQAAPSGPPGPAPEPFVPTVPDLGPGLFLPTRPALPTPPPPPGLVIPGVVGRPTPAVPLPPSHGAGDGLGEDVGADLADSDPGRLRGAWDRWQAGRRVDSPVEWVPRGWDTPIIPTAPRQAGTTWRSGRQVAHQEDVSRWQALAGYQRFLITWSWLPLGYMWITHRAAFVTLLVMATAAALWVIRHRRQTRRHRADVMALWVQLAPHIGVTGTTGQVGAQASQAVPLAPPTRDWLRVPRHTTVEATWQGRAALLLGGLPWKPLALPYVLLRGGIAVPESMPREVREGLRRHLPGAPAPVRYLSAAWREAGAVGPWSWTASLATWVQRRAERQLTMRGRVSATMKATAGISGEIGRVINLQFPGADLAIRWDARLGIWEAYPKPRPPAKITFEQALPYMLKATSHEFYIGHGVTNRPIFIDLEQDAPHVAAVAGTGGGKSITVRTAVTQVVRGGMTHVYICDPKRISHDWARGVPQIDIYRSIEDQVQAVYDFFEEIERRKDLTEIYPDVDHHFELDRRMLVMEEMNTWTRMVKIWWRNVKSKEDPKECPVFDYLGMCLFMGRELKMHVFQVYQQFNAAVAGGSDLRDQVGIKIMARWSIQSWDMLFGTRPRLQPSRHPGRGLVAIGDTKEILQRPMISGQEAREFALEAPDVVVQGHEVPRQSATDIPTPPPISRSGGWVPEAPGLSRSHRPTTPGNQGGEGGTVPPMGHPGLTLMPGGGQPAPGPAAPDAGAEPARLYTLRELSEDKGEGIIPMKYETLRRNRGGDRSKGEFPTGEKRGNVTVYTAEEIQSWYRNRPRAAGEQ